MRWAKLDSKGQVSVELLFLVVIILIIMSAITIPMIGNSIDASMDVSHVSDAKSAVVNIGNAIDIVYANGPGAKRTLDVYIPQNTSLTTTNNQLGTTINDVNYTNNGVSQSSKYVNTTIDYNFNPP